MFICNVLTGDQFILERQSGLPRQSLVISARFSFVLYTNMAAMAYSGLHEMHIKIEFACLGLHVDH